MARLPPPGRFTRPRLKPGAGRHECAPGERQSVRGVLGMRELKRLDIKEVGDVTVVRFRDPRITEDRRIEESAGELFHLVEEANCRKLLLSLASVDILSSAALGKLITLDKKAMARGGVLKLSNLSADVALVFSITRLDRLFDVAKDEETALAAFGHGASHEGVSAPGA